VLIANVLDVLLAAPPEFAPRVAPRSELPAQAQLVETERAGDGDDQLGQAAVVVFALVRNRWPR
jgi:hypothetical protein